MISSILTPFLILLIVLGMVYFKTFKSTVIGIILLILIVIVSNILLVIK